MNLNKSKENENLILTFWVYINFIRKYIYILSLFSVIGLILGIIVAYTKTPLYRSVATVKFDYDTRDVLNSGENFGGGMYLLKTDIVNTEYKIIESQTIALEVVDKVGLPFFQKHYEMKKSSKSLFSLAKSYFSPEKVVEQDPETKNERQRRYYANLLASRIEVEGIKRTNLVEIGFVSDNREAAQKIVNAYVDTYIYYGIQSIYEKNVQAYSFLEKQAEDLQGKIDAISNQIAEYSQDKNVILMGKRDETVDDAYIVKLNASLYDAQTRLLENQSNLQRILATPAPELRDVTQDAVYQDLSTKLIGLKGQYARDLKIYRDQMPRMQSLQKEIEALENSLKSQTDSVYKRILSSARASILASNTEIQSLEKKMAVLQQGKAVKVRMADKTQLGTLTQTMDGLRNQLAIVNSKKEEIDLAINLKSVGRTNKSIIQEGQLPSGPFSPSIRRFGFVGCFAGLILAFSLAFTLEITDRKIHSPEQLSAIASAPLLASVPKIPEDLFGSNPISTKGMTKQERLKNRGFVGFITHDKPTTIFAEAYRQLRTSIQLSTTKQRKVILIASSMSGEGKTITSMNLATAYAQLEKPTLIIDGDLRRPKLHKLFGTSNKLGIVPALVNECDVMDAVQPTNIPHLSILSCGPTIPPNPSELLASEKMAQLILKLRDNFEYIIIDSSPLLLVTDAYIIGHLADLMVLIAKAGVITKEDLTRTLTILDQNKLQLTGLLFNDLDPKKSSAYGYSYGYGYGVGYGYTSYGRRGKKDPDEAYSAYGSEAEEG